MIRKIVIVSLLSVFFLVTFSCHTLKNKKTVFLPVVIQKQKAVVTQKQEDSLTKKTSVIVAKDSVVKKDTVRKDTTHKKIDSISITQLKSKKKVKDSLHFDIDEDSTTQQGGSFLDDIITYSANDSAVLEVDKNDLSLYKKATSDYKGMKSQGDKISMNQVSKNISLFPKKDSLGNISIGDKIKFAQNGTDYLGDTAIFNYSSKKAVTKNGFTMQGDLYVWSDISKKVDDSDIFVSTARFTTCSLDDPHFSFNSSKAKFRKGKSGITNEVFVEIEGVRLPAPIAPFAMFPVSNGERNGILPPNYVQTNDRGIGLINGGYYFKFGDYADLRANADFYSYGSYGFRTTSNYTKRYGFQGGFNLAYQKVYTGLPGDTVRNNNILYSINWNHNIDAKAMPNANFSTNINWQSTKFNQLQVTNNPNLNYQNQISSSISFSQRFKQLPLTFSLSGSHSQNSNTKQINIVLPTFNLAVLNLTPLENLGRGNQWYKKLTLKYDVQARGETFFFDTLVNPLLKNNFKWGAKHNPSISITLPSLGPLNFSPSYSYGEVWTDRKTSIQYNQNDKKLDTLIEKGLYRYYDLNYGVSMTTRIFGTVLFKSSSPIRGIRHVINPNISFNYKPNVNSHNFYNSYDANNKSTRRNYYEGALYGTFSEQQFMGLNFGVSSSLEIKVRNRKDTVNDTKKISLIDNFTINGSYNLTTDTLNVKPLSPISMALSTNIAKKLNLTANGTLDPYALDSTGKQINRTYAWQQGGFSLGRMTNFTVSLSTSFTGKPNTTKKTLRTVSMQENLYEEFLSNDTSKKSNFINYFKSWNLDLRYNVSYANVFVPSTQSSYYGVSGHSFSISGNVALTENWKVGYTSNVTLFDFRPDIFDRMKVNTLGFTLSRDLHCWELNANIVLIGQVKSVSFILRPKSGMLRDVKVEKNRYYRE